MDQRLPQPVFVYAEALENYAFPAGHPFNSVRLQTTVSLLKSTGLWERSKIIPPRPASRRELLLAHDRDYLDWVETHPPQSGESRFGLGTGDNPYFPGMHQASALVAGATLTAAEEVMSGRASHGVSIAGGLHHAHRRQASGFCVYNDLNVAIHDVKNRYQARVLYLDTDVHHGDGVQWEFYRDPQVLTISCHESGRTLFPGSGSVTEQGEGAGRGYCVNVPLEPHTDDASFLECLNLVLPPLVAGFRPDLIISQNGCDGHFLDPLGHLDLTMRSYREIPRLVHQLAHDWAGGRWVAVGGGGYASCQVPPRAWSLLWAEAAQQELPPDLPQDWLDRWQPKCLQPLPGHLMDQPGDCPPWPDREAVAAANRRQAETALAGSFLTLNPSA